MVVLLQPLVLTFFINNFCFANTVISFFSHELGRVA
jgi:hypothetical protein